MTELTRREVCGYLLVSGDVHAHAYALAGGTAMAVFTMSSVTWFSGRSSMTAMLPRLFELRKPSQAWEMRRRLGVAVQRCPRNILDLRLDRLEEAGCVTLKKGDWDAVSIEHAVARERREFRPRRKNAGED